MYVSDLSALHKVRPSAHHMAGYLETLELLSPSSGTGLYRVSSFANTSTTYTTLFASTTILPLGQYRLSGRTAASPLPGHFFDRTSQEGHLQPPRLGVSNN